jgi:hypothetical protein
MATIYYNGVQGGLNDCVTLTDVPNILKVTDTTGGTQANIQLNFTGSLSASYDGQWYITIFGETITNVLDPHNAINKNFYIGDTPFVTATYVARALSNCSLLSANFIIESYSNSPTVNIQAREVGSILENNNLTLLETNISTTDMSRSAEDGTAYSSLNGALIDVKIKTRGEYVTTLEKNWYNGEAAFDLSPVLTTISKHGETTPYTLLISSLKNGSYNNLTLGGITNYSVVGYMCNQGLKYLPMSGFTIAQNVSRGSAASTYNKTKLYVYGTSIPLWFYAYLEPSATIMITYRDSAYNIVSGGSISWTNDDYAMDNQQLLKNVDIPLSQALMNQSFYVDISLGSKTLRYNIIKPLKMTEYYQRVLWRNSYGGVSFFDFTGAKTETRDLEVMTYQKSIFDYYTDTRNELDKVYDNNIKYTVTLKSHLFENDGKYIFNDLLQSSEVWTVINGEEYGIIIDSVSVEEQNNNNIYEATLKYHYSANPSLI